MIRWCLRFALVLTSAAAPAWAQNGCVDWLAAGGADRLTGLGARGFLGTTPAPTPATRALAASLGILRWNVKIFVVNDANQALRTDAVVARVADVLRDPRPDARLDPSLDWAGLSSREVVEATALRQVVAADQGRAVEPNPLMSGLYLILPGVDLKTLSTTETERLIASVRDRDLFEVRDGHLHRLDPALVRARFDPEHLSRRRYFKIEPTHLRQDGWFFPRERGVLMVERMQPETSRTYQKLGVLARRDARRSGLSVRFNAAFEPSLRRVQHQQRLGQTLANARLDERAIADLLAMANEGVAWSFESWAGGDLTGGTYGYFRDGRLSLASIHYRNLNDAKFVFLMLAERLREAGVTHVDLEMVTPFSRTMNGEYIPAPDFLRLHDAADPGAQPNFEAPWSPL